MNAFWKGLDESFQMKTLPTKSAVSESSLSLERAPLLKAFLELSENDSNVFSDSKIIHTNVINLVEYHIFSKSAVNWFYSTYFNKKPCILQDCKIKTGFH